MQKSIKVERFYIIWMIFLSLIYYIPFVMPYADLLLDVSSVFGLFIILYKLIKKHIQVNNQLIILTIFIFSYLITIIVNGFLVNDFKILIYLIITFFIFFENNQNKSIFDITNILIFVISVIFAIISLILFFNKTLIVFHNNLTTDLGIIGLHPNHSLYGLIGNSNRLSWVSILSIFTSLTLLCKNKNKRIKYLFSANIVMQFIVIVFTNSRGGLVGIISFLSCYIFLHLLNNQKSLKKTIFISIISIFISIGGYAGIKVMEDVIFPDLTPNKMHEVYVNGFNISANTGSERSEGEKERTTMARVEAYTAGIKLFFDHPFWGTGKESIAKELSKYLPSNSLLASYNATTNLHSIYLTILVSSGLFGFIILLTFFIIVLRNIKKQFRFFNSDKILIIALLFSFLTINFFESELLYTRSFSCFIFWFYLGLLNKSTPKDISLIRYFINLLLPLYEYLKLTKFRVKWEIENKHNSTKVNNVFDINKVKIGRYTYGNLNVLTFGNKLESLTIGDFCSIANNVQFILGGNHNYSRISTFPFKVHIEGETSEASTKGPIIINDDVWIGQNVIILSGVTVGKGAILAAGSIVTKNVSPYSIYANGKEIKYRFEDKDLIKSLEGFDYNLVDEQFLQKNLSFFYHSITNKEDFVNIYNKIFEREWR